MYDQHHHKVDGMRGFMISAGMASAFASFLCSQTVGTGPQHRLIGLLAEFGITSHASFSGARRCNRTQHRFHLRP